MITGPQATPEQIGDLSERAGVYGARMATDTDFAWTAVTRLLRLTGWDTCPLSLADVGIAVALAIPIVDLT